MRRYMYSKILISVLLLNFTLLTASYAQQGYNINVNIDGFKNDTLLLGYQYADKQYIKDTVIRAADGFTFKGDEKLDCGMYLFILPPENKYFQVLIDDNDQEFKLTTSEENPIQSAKIEGSDENEMFYSYLNYISEQSPKAQQFNLEIKEAKEANKKTDGLQEKLDKLNSGVDKYQLNLIDKYPESLTARIVKASREIKLPDFDMSTDEGKRARFKYLQEHWLDNIDLSDPCLIRTSLLNNKVMTYLEKLTPQVPDSIIQSVDVIIEKASGNEETKRNWLSTLLNKYANSKVIGMDAVYVHLIFNYYAKGDTPWVDEEKLQEMIENATKTEPLLIGKIAPEIALPTLDIEATLKAMEIEENEQKKFVIGDKISLHGLDSPFKVLFIWAPDCGHCKKSMPKMVEFYDKFEDRGVKMYAICHQNYKKTPDCAEFITERPGMLKWLNVTDPYFRSKYQTIYNVKSTPQIYILDENNEILIKRIGADQISEVMEELIIRSKK